MEPKTSCIIPAFNEAARIAGVLKVVSVHPDVDEIIVIDDGSTDGTAAVVAGYPSVRLIRHSTNLGKSRSLIDGVQASKHDLLFFLDADLLGLTHENVTNLIEPVRAGRSEMTMSLRKNSLLVYRLMGCDFVSGERVIPRTLLQNEHEAIAELPSFGFEVYVNRLAFDKDWRVKVVRWPSVITPSKSSKRGFFSGWYSDIQMLKDIFTVITPLELLQQNYFLLGLR